MKKVITKEQKEKIISLYKEKKAVPEIISLTNVNRTTVYREIQKHNNKIAAYKRQERRQRVWEQAFSNEDKSTHLEKKIKNGVPWVGIIFGCFVLGFVIWIIYNSLKK